MTRATIRESIWQAHRDHMRVAITQHEIIELQRGADEMARLAGIEFLTGALIAMMDDHERDLYEAGDEAVRKDLLRELVLSFDDIDYEERQL